MSIFDIVRFFLRPSAEAEDIQLTHTGKDNQIYNGIPDWVNEEEVLEDNKAIWWSPDGSKLLYGVFDDTRVDIVQLPRYGYYKNKGVNLQGYPFLQYFMQDSFRYPKAGTVNPRVTLWCAFLGPPGKNQLSQTMSIFEGRIPNTSENVESSSVTKKKRAPLLKCHMERP